MSENAKKIEDNRTTNLFISKKINNSEKDNQHVKKKYIKFISIKMPYFKIENNSNIYKKKIYMILILIMGDGQKKKGIDLFKELLYMELIGRKSKL